MAQAFEPRPSLGGRSTVSHRRKEHFCFPILKNSEIVQCLNELGLDVTEDTLARCRADSLHGVYEHLLMDCLDVTKEDLHQPKFYGLDALKHAELHEDSVPAMHFVRAMDKLLVAAGVSAGFCVRDLVKPDARRTRRNLSAIINFHKFRDERLAVFQELSDETERLMAVRDAAAAERDALAAELAAERERRAAEQPELEALRAECLELGTEIASLNQQQARMRQAAAETKEAISAAKARSVAAVASRKEAAADTAAIRARIVGDPDSIKARLAEASAALEDEKTRLSDTDRRRRETAVKTDVVTAATRDVEKCVSTMQEAADEAGRLGRAEQAVRARTAELEAAKLAQDDAEAELRTAMREAERLEGRVRDFRPSGERKRDAAQRALQGVQDELEAVRAERDSALHRAAEARKRADADAARAKTAEAERDAAVSRVERGRTELAAAARSHHSRVLRDLSSLAAGGNAPASAPFLGESSLGKSRVARAGTSASSGIASAPGSASARTSLAASRRAATTPGRASDVWGGADAGALTPARLMAGALTPGSAAAAGVPFAHMDS